MRETSNLFDTINELYGRFMWKVANRYSAYTLTPRDIFHDVLIRLHDDVRTGRCALHNQARMHSIILSRSIDLFRGEYRHFRHDRWARVPFDVSDDPRTRRQSLDASGVFRDAEFRDHLLVQIDNTTDAKIICEIIWPSEQTQDLARRDAEAAYQDSKGTTHVRMNCSDPINARVLKKHVAESLGVSQARVSAALKRAAADINKLLGE